MDPYQNSPFHHQQHHHMSHHVDRFGQWGFKETKDFLEIRADVDAAFLAENKRNKKLHWDMVTTRMKEHGYVRTPQQCKAKWKTLVYQYKACENTEPQDIMRQQFPFYKEMQHIFNARMQRMLWLEAYEGTGRSGSKKKLETLFSSDDEEDSKGQDYTTTTTTYQGDHHKRCTKKKRRVMKKEGKTTTSSTSNSDTTIVDALEKMMENYVKNYKAEEMQLMREYEEREEQRRTREVEWRQEMKALENERLMMERSFRERDEQMRMVNESRAHQRDALMDALLNKLKED